MFPRQNRKRKKLQIQKQNQSNLYMLASWARNDVMHISDRFKDESGAVHKRRRSSWAIFVLTDQDRTFQKKNEMKRFKKYAIF